MKAAMIEKPGILAIHEIPPPVMGEYDALCELLYGATCTGTDQHLLFGRFPWPVKYPTVLGHESVGRVIQVGAKVRNYKVGDLITRVGTRPAPDGSYDVNWGGFAEFGIARDHAAMEADGQPTDQWYEFRVNQVIPPDIDPKAGTMFITWRETLSYVTRMQTIKAGSTVLVLGSGGNGLAFLNHAVNLGAKAAMIGSDTREDTAKALGAADYFSYKDGNIGEAINKSFPDGFDVVIDAVGKQGLLDAALAYTKPGGVVTMYGLDDYGACMVNPCSARGTFTYYVGGYDEAETHEQVVELVRAGKLNAAHWLNLDTPFTLDQIGDAFRAILDRKMVKALVKIKA